MIGGVYKIVNKTNGHFYVGSSVNLNKRFWRHKNELRKDKHHCLFLQRAWNKYGEENFEFVVLKTCTELEAKKLEQDILNQNIDNTYNLNRFATGGDLLSNHPNREEIICRIKQTFMERLEKMTPEQRREKFGLPKEKNPMFGRTHSDEVKLKISAKQKGHSRNKGIKRTEETRMKLSLIASQRTGEKNPFFGKRHSAETKQRIAKSKYGKKAAKSTSSYY